MRKIIHYLRQFKQLIVNDRLANLRYKAFKEQFDQFKAGSAAGVKFAEYPLLNDNTGITPIEPHYTYHPAWAARVLAEIKPTKHIDISSTTNFSTIASAFVPFEFYDYRPANIHLSNYTTGKADLTDLHFETGSIESLSCMHTVEHIGLGRYGDPLDVDGDLKAMKELARVLKPGGNFMFVTPIGTPRIEFNAHRVYSYEMIINSFSGLELKEFTLIPDDFENVGYIKNPAPGLVDTQVWGCGCFWFTKK